MFAHQCQRTLRLYILTLAVGRKGLSGNQPGTSNRMS